MIQENPGQIKGPGTEFMCPALNHPQQSPIRMWLLPAGLSSRVSRHNADRLGGGLVLPPKTTFYEESVLLKYFPLDASCVSRSWSCQLELMTVEKNTSKCCCDMAFGSGAQRGAGAGRRQHGKRRREHPAYTRNVAGVIGMQPCPPSPHKKKKGNRNSWNDVLKYTSLSPVEHCLVEHCFGGALVEHCYGGALFGGALLWWSTVMCDHRELAICFL